MAALEAPRCSVVVPVFNEAESLPQLASEIRRAMEPLDRPYEVLFVDDGSADGSLGVLKEIAGGDGRVRVLAFDRNHGQSAALDAGIRAARGDVIVTLDADLQNDPADIPLLLRELDRCDVALGWRFPRRDGFVKRVSSRVGNAVRNWVMGDAILDSGCSLRAFKREAAARVKLFRGMHRFLPTLFRMEGFTLTQVQVSHRPRLHGRSKYGTLDRLVAALPDLLAVRWMQAKSLRYRIRERVGGDGA